MAEYGIEQQEKQKKKEQDNNIVIDLEQSSNAIPYNAQNIIQKIEFDRVIKWISDRIAYVSNNSDQIKNSNKRFNDTISVLGTRGSGKTSFLLSVKNYCSHGKLTKDTAVLPMIDPTLIEEKGHILLTIISLIKDCVEEKLDKSDASPLSNEYKVKKEWRDKLRSLAEGLPSIDGIGSGLEGWTDAEFIMDKGLKAVKAAKNLEKDFSELVQMGLGILGKKIFLLTLDDIDVNIQRGWSVLETVRKYLTTPYIVTMVSGDLRLYSKTIRKQQWKNFGKPLLLNEGDRLSQLEEYDSMVTEIESQYMQKILQPKYRLHLMLLRDILNMGKFTIKVIKYDENENKKLESKTIVEEYNEILGNIGISNNFVKAIYRSYLLALPLRTQIEYMLASNQSINAQIDPFLSEIYNEKVNIDLLRYAPQYTNIEILKFLLKEHLLYESYQLQPIALDNSLNTVMFAFNIIFGNQYHQYPYIIFDYLIRIGYTRHLLQLIPYRDVDDRKNLLQIVPNKDLKVSGGVQIGSSIENMCTFANMMQDTSLYHISCHIASYLRASIDNGASKISSNGTMILRGLGSRTKDSEEDNISAGRIDSIFRNASIWQRSVAFLPLSIAQSNSKSQSLVIYSLFTLLASIGNIVRCYNFNLSDDENKKNIKSELSYLAQIRSFPMPNFERGTSGDNIQQIIDLEELGDDSTYSEYDEFCGLLLKWVKDFNDLEKLQISPQLLGKISTRMLFALQSLEEFENSAKEKLYKLGEAMHRRMVILLNTILIEDYREHIDELNLSNNNPITDDDIFINNLKKLPFNINGIRGNLLLFYWLIKCPLIISYIRLYEKINDDCRLSKLGEILINDKQVINQDEYDKLTISTKLNDVSLALQSIKKDSSKELPPFSMAKKNKELTLKIIKQEYSNLENFKNDGDENIINRLSGKFDKISKKVIHSIKNQK